jgi:hypothetical protein
MKELTFEMNACQKLSFISGESVQIYILMKYKNAPEYFAHSLTVPARVKFWKQDGTVASFNGQLVCYYPGCFVISLSGTDTANLRIGPDQDVEIELQDVSEQKHVAQGLKVLTVLPKKMA